MDVDKCGWPIFTCYNGISCLQPFFFCVQPVATNSRLFHNKVTFESWLLNSFQKVATLKHYVAEIPWQKIAAGVDQGWPDHDHAAHRHNLEDCLLPGRNRDDRGRRPLALAMTYFIPDSNRSLLFFRLADSCDPDVRAEDACPDFSHLAVVERCD
jgi:hypothetical protein